MEQYIKSAQEKYNLAFFNNFSFRGFDSHKLSQKQLEEHILFMTDPVEIDKLMVSMVTQSFELNELIPNIELLISKIFCSPYTKINKDAADSKDLLANNLFAQKKVKLSPQVYESLLHTNIVRPKKKHFKKIIQYMRQFEDASRMTPEIVDLVVKIGINHQYPVTLGKYMRDIIVHDDYKIDKETFMKFVMYLEKSKGFEEDAKKFLLLTGNSSHLQIDYKMIKPMVIRLIKYQDPQTLMDFFNNLSKNIQLNKSWDDKDGK